MEHTPERLRTDFTNDPLADYERFTGKKVVEGNNLTQEEIFPVIDHTKKKGIERLDEK